MTTLSEFGAGLRDRVGEYSAEVAVAGVLVGGAALAVPPGVGPEVARNAAFGGGLVLLMLGLWSNEGVSEPCPVCGHDTEGFPSYCGVCGTALTDDERETVVETARRAAREEAREVASE